MMPRGDATGPDNTVVCHRGQFWAAVLGAPASRNFNSGDINPVGVIPRRAHLSPNAKNSSALVT